MSPFISEYPSQCLIHNLRIVAILIGKLKFTVSKAIDAYTKLASVMPNEPAKDDDERKENMEKFEEAFKEVLKGAEIDPNTPFLDDEEPKMYDPIQFLADIDPFYRLICTSNTINASILYPLRSYRTRGTRPPAFSLLQAACASIASPDRFLPVTIGLGHREAAITSAMVGYANPTKELLREAGEVFGTEAEVATILSIGAGRVISGIIGDQAKGVGIGVGLRQGGFSSKQVHEELQMRLGETMVYFRFNMDYELGVEPKVVSAHISDYLSERAVSSRLDDAIKSLQSRPKGLLLKEISMNPL